MNFPNFDISQKELMNIAFGIPFHEVYDKLISFVLDEIQCGDENKHEFITYKIRTQNNTSSKKKPIFFCKKKYIY